MVIKWKRNWENKIYNFEIEYLLNCKINHSEVKMPRIYLENTEMQDSIKSTLENFTLDKINLKKQRDKSYDLLSDESKVRNHFRNVCFRKKFSTIKDTIQYISKYYGLDELKVLSYVSFDLDTIKEQTKLR